MFVSSRPVVSARLRPLSRAGGKVLGKRIRKRGRGRTTGYLVQFKGCSDKFTMWTAAQTLPQDAVGELERVAAT